MAVAADTSAIQEEWGEDVVQVTWVVESDSEIWAARSTPRSALFVAVATLTLTCMGGSVLPMPYALSRIGVAVGLAVMLLVALCNDVCTGLLIRAAAATGLDSYEALSEWAGGRKARVVTQLFLLLLLWGPNAGGLLLISDVAQKMMDALVPAGAAANLNVPQWLLSGQAFMVAVTILVLYPLSCRRHMHDLQGIAVIGLLMVLGLAVLLAWRAVQLGFPALASGALPLWWPQDLSELPGAFSVVSYAFYLAPLMMPLIREMPGEGTEGLSLLQKALHLTLLGSVLFIYASCGFFGAAIFGPDTQGNIMLNDILPLGHPWAVVLVYGSMQLFLCFGAALAQFPLRTSLDVLCVGDHVPMTLARSAVLNGITIFSSLGIALVMPGASETIFSVVGATAVCFVCYVLPVWFHFIVRQRCPANQKALVEPLLSDRDSPLLMPLHHAPKSLQAAWRWLQDVAVPLLMLALGLGFSAAALWVAVADVLRNRQDPGLSAPL